MVTEVSIRIAGQNIASITSGIVDEGDGPVDSEANLTAERFVRVLNAVCMLPAGERPGLDEITDHIEIFLTGP